MIDVEPLIISGLDQLVSLPSGAGADWQDVLRRAGEKPRRRWFDALLPHTRSRLRFALVVVVLGLLLAGVATATYVAVHKWVSASPRGPQYTSTYRLSSVFTTKNLGSVESFALGPGGHDLYFVRDAQSAPQVWRVSHLDRGVRHQATRVVDFRTLPGLREPIGGRGGLGVGPNGDLFLVACARPVGREPECDLVLYVVRPDESRQRILSGDDLIRSKLVPSNGGWWWAPAATAPNRLWIPVGPYKGIGRLRLLEVVDPNADGDWSDRVVRPVALPTSLASGFWQLAAEPPLPGDDRSRSVLAAVRTTGWRFRIYRIADRNDDGDAFDPGEVHLLFAPKSPSSQFAPLLGDRDGRAQRREIVVARADRISVFDDSEGLKDVGRAFSGIRTVLGGSRGRIYVVAGSAVYRLEPGAVGARSQGSSPTVSSGRAVFALPPPVASGSPRLMFEISGADRGESYTVRADGRGLLRLVPGTHVRDVCESSDGREVTYASDAEVPTEFAAYMARDSERPKKVPGRYTTPICPFQAGSPPLKLPIAISLLRHVLRTGRETRIAGRISLTTVSPDGTRLVVVRSLARSPSTGAKSQTLELLDLETLRHRQLASLDRTERFGFVGGPKAGSHVGTWSPDATRVAYYTGQLPGSAKYWRPVRHRTVLWVRDVATGNVALRLPLTGGGRPFISWSSDGRRLLVCIENTGMQPACPAAAGDGAIDVGDTPAKLLLVDLRSRSVRVVARGRLTFAGWAPSGETYAYAIGGLLFVQALGDTSKRVATVPEAYWKHRLPWLGWSPDGRFIGLGTDGQTAIRTIDVKSGKLKILRPLGRRHYENVRWWRPPSP
jgi:hypothetical protein